ncbi:MAG: glycine cleavage system aminomethyltransferase GcvT [Thermoplasmata archaeon]|nr:MAG: glycine cleavage system aminomethyltransferase GcvT [Thermoplasmata archaeon]
MKTALYELHRELGATFTTFMGYEMPLMYDSIQKEHLNVRHGVGIFDVSHMGNIIIKGRDAERLLSKITVERAEKIKKGMGQYTLLLNQEGHILDDGLFFNLGENEYLVIPNSGMHESIASWMEEHVEGNVDVEDVTNEYSILAVQGPHSEELMKEVIDFDFSSLKFFGCEEAGKRFTLPFNGRCIVSRSGYTGEKGYEMYIHPAEEAVGVFRELLERGKKYGALPVGLGARDTLRLEKGFMLAGNEFEGGRNPIEANLEWTIDWEHDFIGKEALMEFKKKEEYEKITFLKCTGDGIPRHGDSVFKDGEQIGVVSSGNFSPCLKKGIALAYMGTKYRDAGNRVVIKGRRDIEAEIIKGPFVKKGEC